MAIVAIKSGPGHRGEWPVLLLLAAVLLPTACVLWLMNEGIRSQRVFLRQKLGDTYHSQISLVRDRLESEWPARAAALDEAGTGAAAFARIATSAAADSAILLDSSGAPVYPAPVRMPASDPLVTHPAWTRARQLEDRDPAAALSAYQEVAQSASSPALAARAWQAAARCLVQSGRGRDAATLVATRFTGDLERAIDLQGRLIAGDASLMALHFLPPSEPDFNATARRLHHLLVDYSNPMPSVQRLFLMKEMAALKLPPELTSFPTLAAETLAAQWLEAEPRPSGENLLRPGPIPGTWKLASPGRRILALFRTETVAAQVRGFLARQALPPDIRIAVLPPDASQPASGVIQEIAAGASLPGWRLTLSRTGPEPFEDLASRQMTLYLWIGSLVVVAVSLLAVLATRLVRRSLRVAGIKADLVATVSHELKTPLSSMRLLVDTLLEDEVFDPQKTREYLELIARENSRLSLLIANFLAFSRIERNRYTFEFVPSRVEDVVQAAVSAAGERFREPGCRLTVDVDPGLPEIRADEGALVTALVNLLDNAYKYTPGDKHIAVRAYSQGAGVCLEVSDNGIGIAPRETGKIFLKFYQADRKLSQTGGGCGLGLSIVRFLVEAHGGTVRVTSEPGKGSTFTVALGAS